MQMFDPAHPGELLREFMQDGLTVTAFAKHLRMTRANLSMILNGRLAISPAVAMKLGDALPAWDAEFWMRLQMQYDLAQERRKKRTKILPLLQKAA